MSRLKRSSGQRESTAAAREAVLALARREGPMRTLHRAARGELGGPVWARLVAAPFGNPLADPLRFRVMVFVGPIGLGIAALGLLDSLLTGGVVAWPIALAVFLAVLGLLASTGAFLLALRATRGAVWRRVKGWSMEDLVVWGLLLVVTPTVAFGAVSAVLAHEGVIGVRGLDPASEGLPLRTTETYLWHLADSIPILKVPETLDWKPRATFEAGLGTAMILAYKILLVLPLVQLAAIALSRAFGEGPDSPQLETPSTSTMSVTDTERRSSRSGAYSAD